MNELIKNNFNMKTYKFDKKSVKDISADLSNWPTIYIIYDENNKVKHAYIGETTNVIRRIKQHLSNKEKNKLKFVKIIFCGSFNKSVTLTLEHFLILYMSSDGKFKLLNSNNGMHEHKYYLSDEYENEFKYIWHELEKEGLIDETNYKNLENKDIFKYSPYKSLDLDQYNIVEEIIGNLADNIEKDTKSMFLVEGGPGTGKSILAIYIIKRLIDLIKDNNDENPEDEKLRLIFQKKMIKIGLVVPMQSFRKTIQQVFKGIDGLQVKMVISPFKVINSQEEYDIVIVDESHRLSKRNSTRSSEHKIYFEKYGTQLDWIIKKSKHQIFFYDNKQYIRSSDMGRDIFKDTSLYDSKIYKYKLKTQFRCLAGNDYIQYISDIFSDKPPKKMINFNKKNVYEFYLFDDVNEMVELIKDKAKDERYKLSRVLSGYAWPWNKGKKDIKIGKYSYVWNTTNIDFINSKNAINEVGCIHTSQGYDLNYAGIIIGNDIKYDTEKKKIVIDKNNYCDKKGKQLISDEELKECIINIYNVLLTRGINGTYVYACDENLKKYLSKFIPKWKEYNDKNEEKIITAAETGEEFYC